MNAARRRDSASSGSPACTGPSCRTSRQGSNSPSTARARTATALSPLVMCSTALLLSCEHAADPAVRVGHVARIARDQVEVDVHARLARGLPDVDPDVVAVGLVLLMNEPLRA